MNVIGKREHVVYDRGTGETITTTIYQLKCANKKKWYDEHEEYDDSEEVVEDVEN